MLINVNGQSYTRWEDVPPEVRQQLAATLPDADKNGVPDLFEGNLQGLPSGTAPQTFTSSTIIVNGQPVQSAADLSPEMQAKLQQALGMLGPMFGAAMGNPAMAPLTPGMPAAPTAVPAAAGTPQPLQPGQVMLNGVPTSVSATTPAKKPFWRRIFGG